MKNKKQNEGIILPWTDSTFRIKFNLFKTIYNKLFEFLANAPLI